MTTQEKPQILVNLNDNELILLTSPKKVNSIIKNISNFIFTNILPVYNTDIKESKENIYNKEDNSNKEDKSNKEQLDILKYKDNPNILFLKWDLEAQRYN